MRTIDILTLFDSNDIIILCLKSLVLSGKVSVIIQKLSWDDLCKTTVTKITSKGVIICE